MAQQPKDPVFLAWIVLMALVLGVILNTVLLFLGCAEFHEQSFCERTGNNLRDVTLEIITAVAVLVSQRR